MTTKEIAIEPDSIETIEEIDTSEQAPALNIIKATPGGAIESNYEQVAAYVQALASQYDGVNAIKSSAHKKQAKNERAYLNSIKGQIDAERKRLKAEYMRPYTDWETKIKADILEPLQGASNNIKSSLDDFDARWKQEKYDELKEFYEELAPMLIANVPYERLHDDRYLNATYSTQNAKDDIADKVNSIAEGQTLITKMGYADDAHLEVMRYFFESLNATESIKRFEKAEEERARVRELQEQQKALEETRRNAQAAKAAIDRSTSEGVKPSPISNASTKTKWSLKIDSEFVATKEQATHLAGVLKSLGISGSIKKVADIDE